MLKGTQRIIEKNTIKPASNKSKDSGHGETENKANVEYSLQYLLDAFEVHESNIVKQNS